MSSSKLKKKDDVCIVIVHFGKTDITSCCIESIANLYSKPYILICNNDNSTKGQRLEEVLHRLKLDKRSKVIQNQKNEGFAAGCNTGIKHALKLKYKYVWLLNNDTVVSSGTLSSLYNCALKHKHAIIGSTVIDMAPPEKIQAAGGVTYNSWTSVITPVHAGISSTELDNLQAETMDYIYGASMFIPVELFNKTGLVDEAYFLYYEELDICKRAVDMGWELIWCRESIVKHHGGVATGTKLGDTCATTQFTIFHNARSLILFTRQHYPHKLLTVIPVNILGRLPLLILRKQTGLIIPFLRGLFSGLTTPKQSL